MFFIFIRACKKYGFTYLLDTNSGFMLILHPIDDVRFIKIEQGFYERNYLKLFLSAIKKMKAYRKGSVC